MFAIGILHYGFSSIFNSRYNENFDSQRESYRLLNKVFHKLNKNHVKLDTLSMGTTIDMNAAIAEGATFVRIGTAIFGPRIQ